MGLKEKVLKGSFYLTLRQLLAAAFSLVSTLVIARKLGPESYGIASASLGIFYFMRWSSRIGLNTYITRQPDLEDEQVEHILAFYNIYGVLLCTLMWFVSAFFGTWMQTEEVTSTLRLLVPFLWFDLISNISVSLLNRDLRFDRISLVDVLGQVANYALSIPLVLIYQSYWAPIIGTAVQVCISGILAIKFRPVPLRWKWKWKFLKPALNYGLKFHLSVSLQHLRTLTVPLLVSRLISIEAVGIINIAVRMVQQLFLLRDVLRRMSISVMAKLMEDSRATMNALNNGMLYQALVMGVICAGFSSLSIWVVPLVFGSQWLPSAQLVPILGMAALLGAIFDLHAALLHAVDRSKEVSISNAVHVALLWGSSLILLPRFDIWGYGLAELFAVPSYVITHLAVSRFYQASPEYQTVFWIIAAALPATIGGLFLESWIGFPLFLLSYILLFVLNREARGMVTEIRVMLRAR